MYRSFFRQYWMLAKQSMISCQYMCPFCKLFNLFFFKFLSFIYRIQRDRLCWFCPVWTDDSSLPYPHPWRTVGMCDVKMQWIFCLVENTYNAEVCRWWVFFFKFQDIFKVY